MLLTNKAKLVNQKKHGVHTGYCRNWVQWSLAITLNNWDTYIQHLKNLAEDTLYKPKDHQNMKDSLKTWSRPNILFLHPFFITALEIPSIFSYSFQSKIFDRAKALCCITKAKERLHLFDKKEFDELPHVKTYYVELILMRQVSICTKMSH